MVLNKMRCFGHKDLFLSRPEQMINLTLENNRCCVLTLYPESPPLLS
jgi:hypothetical protein